MNQTEKTNARALRVLALRKRGASLEQIATTMGITRQYVNKLEHRGRRVEADILAKNPAGELSERLRNALVNDGCDPSRPETIVAHIQTLAQLKRVPNIGVKCIQELNHWLRKHKQEPIR